MKNLARMVLIEGQDLPEHLKLKGAVFAMSLLPPGRGGGRFLDPGDVGRNNVVISTRIARDYPNADGTPKRVGQTIRIGTEDFTIVGLYDTGSLVTDLTIVMEIGVARRLLKVPDKAVSTFAVEPLQVTDTDALAERIEAALPGVLARAHQPVQPDGERDHGQARPVPARGRRTGPAGRRGGHREHDADEHLGEVRRLRRHAQQRLDAAEHPRR